MAYLKLVRCRLAIQCCIGYFPDGRERHRTFSLQDIRPDASADALASVVRAVAPLLAYPITKVSIVKKYVLMLDNAYAPTTPKTFGNARDAGQESRFPFCQARAVHFEPEHSYLMSFVNERRRRKTMRQRSISLRCISQNDIFSL